MAESGEEEKRNSERADPIKARFKAIKARLEDQVLKVLLSVVLVTFAITRIFYYEALGSRMDLVFFSLILSVFLLWMFPWGEFWDRLRGFNVGAFAISLQQPDVQAAIGNLSFAEEQLKNSGSSLPEEVRDKLRRRLKPLEGELQTVRGSRILWIDDEPHSILGERRLLRALGIDVTPARSSQRAKEILKEDHDFDLILTDTWRCGTREGVNFVVKLRTEETDARIKNLPVIFYAADSWETLVNVTRPAVELSNHYLYGRLPVPEISNSVDDLIPKVIRKLSEERRNPIIVSAKKTSTEI
jgi:CheY-like chemotaxis protein